MRNINSLPISDGNSNISEITNTPVSITDHLIQGQMICVSYSINDSAAVHFQNDDEFKEHVRNIVAKKLADEIIKNKLAEFTFESNKLTQQVLVRGRCFLTPNSDVKILRKANI